MVTDAIKRHGVRERYITTGNVSRYLLVGKHRYWAFRIILNRALQADVEGKHQPVKGRGDGVTANKAKLAGKKVATR